MVRRRPGVALALVLVALILVGALAAGAVMAAGQGMRDAAGALGRVRALAAAEDGLARAAAPPSWDPARTAPGPPGLVATIAFAPPGAVDTVRVVRLDSASWLLISEARTLAPASIAAHARIARHFTSDASGALAHPHPHSFTTAP
ncbi:MAG TPA: hypothetical protein VMT93_11120 [Gemmatimonadaceae bacterium]|nr:hypothetical protein [Gemmatimonadaceae bacterium]